jgi:hypothetical protein
MAVQRGRSERRGEAYFFTRPPRACDRLFPRVPYGEPLNDARTKLGERRVSARRGWAGEKRDFFNILLAPLYHNPGEVGE